MRQKSQLYQKSSNLLSLLYCDVSIILTHQSELLVGANPQVAGGRLRLNYSMVLWHHGAALKSHSLVHLECY